MRTALISFAAPVLALFLLSCPCAGQENESEERPQRWMLICCGLPGDEPHRERLTEACRELIQSSESVLGIAADRLRVLAGDEEMVDALASHTERVSVCDRESIGDAVRELAMQVPKEDGVWILLLGHAHLYGGGCQFNVRGPDIDQTQFAQLAKSLECDEQVIWNTLPVSGFWNKALGQPGRIVISATEDDLEFTGTEMPYALSDVLAGTADHQPLEDIDGDEQLSLLDLYLATNIEVTMRFREIDRLQTEHAQLDDNGDGRGSEVQAKYLPPEPEDTEAEEEQPAEAGEEDEAEEDDESSEAATDETPEVVEKPPVITQTNRDGYRSRFVKL